MKKRLLAMLLVLMLVVSLLPVGALAEPNDTEFHIIGISTMKDFVRQALNVDDDAKITIHGVEVYGLKKNNPDKGTSAFADGGVVNHGYLNQGDVGARGTNGKLTGYDDIWTVLNSGGASSGSAIIDEESITHIVIYAKTGTGSLGYNGDELDPVTLYLTDGSIKYEQLGGKLVTEIYLEDASLEPPEPEPEQFTLTTSADSNSTIDEGKTFEYSEEGTITVKFYANTGYKIATVTVDGSALTGDALASAIENGFVTVDMKDNHSVGVTSEAKTYRLHYTWDSDFYDEAELPEDEYHQYGENVVLSTMYEVGDTITTDKYIYEFQGWKYGGKPVTEITMPASDISVEGKWINKGEAPKYNVTYEFEGDAPKSFTPNIDEYDIFKNEQAPGSIQNVPTGLKAESEDGTWTFNGWTSEDVVISDDNKFTMPAKDVHLVGTWTFTPNEPEQPTVYEIYVTVHNGTATFCGSEVTRYILAVEGEDITITFTPDEGYTLDYATIDGNTLQIPDDGVYTLKLVDSDHTIEVFYAEDELGGGEDGNEPDGTPDYRQVFVKYVAGDGNGVVNPSFDTFNLEVDENGKVKTVPLSLNGVATPNAGATFAYWTIEGLGYDGGAYSYEADLSGEDFIGYVAGVTYTFTAYFNGPVVKPEEPNVFDIYVTVHNGTATFCGSEVTRYILAVEGEDITITFTPDEGYTLDYATIDGNTLQIPDDGVYTLKLVDSDHTIEVFYAEDELGGGEDGNEPDGTPDYRQVFVKYVAGDENGFVTPSFDTFDLDVDENGKVMTDVALALSGTATANTDASFGYWTIEGSGYDGGTYSFEADLENENFSGYLPGETYTFTAYFNGPVVKPEQPTVYDIYVTVHNGTATFYGSKVTSSIRAAEGEDITITFTPDEGYTLDYATIDGGTLLIPDGGVYTLKQVDSDHTIEVFYAKDENGGGEDGDEPDGIADYKQLFVKYASADSKLGSVSPACETFTLEVDELGKVLTDPVTLSGTAAADENAEFAYWTITGPGYEGGAYSYDSDLKSKAFSGYVAGKTYTFTAYFNGPVVKPEEPKVFDIYVTVHNGTATFYGSKVTSSIRAAEGEDITITFTPDEGYTLDYATIDDGTLLIPDDGVYTLKLVDSNHTIEVFYAEDKLGGGDDGTEPDGTPDYRQVFVKYVAADGNGFVTPSFDTFNLEVDENGKVITEVALSLSGEATPNADATFAYWTIEGPGYDGGAYSYEADLSGKDFIGYFAGQTYTFTAHFNGPVVKPEQVEYDINVEVVNGTAEFKRTNIGANSVIKVYPIEDDNKNVTITFVPEDGFVFDAAYVGNEPVDLKDNSYTFGEVTADVTIKVLFKQDSVPITPVTPMPTPGEISDLIKDSITVDCVNGEVAHADKVYGLLDGSLVSVEKTDDTSIKVTLDATVYQAQYNTDTETKHSLADGQSATVTFALNYVDQTWRVAKGELPITIKVVCETPVEPEPTPDPAITGFSKTLVKDRNLYVYQGLAYPTFYRGSVIVDEGDGVTLLYKITVKGTPGTEFTVRDDSADFVQTGEIPDSGETSFYVAKTFTWREIRRADELTNTAAVLLGDKVAGSDTETVDVDIDWDYNPPLVDDDDDDEDEDDDVFVPNWLNTEDHYSYIVGYEDGTIKPNNNITRAEVATIFYRLLTDSSRERWYTDSNSFTDVADDSWYNEPVSTLSRMGIIDGYEDGTFKPNAPITRAEFTAIATRFFDYSARYDGAFYDVSAGSWYADYIQAAVDMGLVEGYPDGGVHPGSNITRAEAVTIVNRVLNRVPHEDHLLSTRVMNTWPDNKPGAWYYADMQEATNSHDYDWTRVDGKLVEDWTNKLADPNW